MRKFIITVVVLTIAFIGARALYYDYGVYLPHLGDDEAVACFTKTDGKTILLDRGDGFEPFEIRGVNMGSGEPGEWSTDYDIDYDSYYRWFGLMQEMGANTLRVYSIQADLFYDAFYDYNTERVEAGEEPLWLLHGVWVNDYTQFSHLDMYTDEFLGTLIKDSKTMVDVIHGKRDVSLGRKANAGSGSYRSDISPWVIGYILGIDWESKTVSYTDQIRSNEPLYKGKYMSASEDATPFESALANAGDELIRYETDKYNEQRLTAFVNCPATDPFKYSAAVTSYYGKLAAIDVEHIETSDAFRSGTFASYHVYPYYPDYLESMEKEAKLTKEELAEMNAFFGYKKLEWRVRNLNCPNISSYMEEGDSKDRYGRKNTYLGYLKALNRYHTVPVIISEFGVSTGRGMAQLDENTGRNQGHMSEQEQGQAVIECCQDIKDAGCAGCCVSSWQDEWFKRTWNTMHAVDLRRTPYWSDYQTSEQYLGLLSFDPGEEKSVCYVDGDTSEWSADDVVTKNKNMTLSMKYDEKFLYFYVNKPDFDFKNDVLYIPVDTTPKSGSKYCSDHDLNFDCAADFLIEIKGRKASRVTVQERYDALRSTYSPQVYGFNTYFKSNMPEKDSPKFTRINMILKTDKRFFIPAAEGNDPSALTIETGKLKYGNANPSSEDFNSLADFMVKDGDVELKIPWQLLNFADPSCMSIHDDYYENYGVEYIDIDSMKVGISDGTDESSIPTEAFELEGWGNDVTYHERLKRSYDMLKEYWTNNGEETAGIER